mgnify:CR=1 FL=1
MTVTWCEIGRQVATELVPGASLNGVLELFGLFYADSVSGEDSAAPPSSSDGRGQAFNTA